MPDYVYLTNVFSKITAGQDGEYSTLTIEGTAPVHFAVNYPEPDTYRVIIKAGLAMYPGPLEVRDGIIKNVTIEKSERQVVLEIKLEEAVRVEITTVEGVPYRIVLKFSRSTFYTYFRDKVIVVDPGHGGGDPGFKGPVNLLEKDMAWKTAQRLADILKTYRAKVIMTRSEEEGPPWNERIKKIPGDADCFISIHYHGASDPENRGTAVQYNSKCPGNEELATAVLKNIIAKTKTPSRGIKADPELDGLGMLPALRLEPAVITNWVDEGLLRNPHFHKKTALSAVITLKQHLRRES